MKLIRHATVHLGAGVRLVDDGLNSVALRPVVCVAGEGTHLLVERDDGALELRALDRSLTVVETIAVPDRGETDDAEVAAFSVTARRAFWASGTFDGNQPHVESTALASFGDAERSPLQFEANGLAPTSRRHPSVDGEHVHGAAFGEDGALWLAIAMRRHDDITLYVARAAPDDTTVRHALALATVKAGSTYAKNGFGEVRFTRVDEASVLASVASMDGESERARVVVAWDGAALVSRGLADAEAGADALDLRFRDTSTMDGFEDVDATLEEARSLEGDVEIAVPWEVPRAVKTPDGPGLLALGVDEEGLFARMWLVVA